MDLIIQNAHTKTVWENIFCLFSDFHIIIKWNKEVVYTHVLCIKNLIFGMAYLNYSKAKNKCCMGIVE